jgi:hypothetical protein
MNKSERNLLPNSNLRKLINLTYLKINSDFIENDENISEYEIQHSFFKLLKNQLKNKGCKVSKEKEKVDIIVTDNEETLKYCFEVKSFIKSHEKIEITSINKDIASLEKFLSDQKEKIEKRAFVLLAIREKTLQSSKSQNSILRQYLNHKSKDSNLLKANGFKHILMSSYTIAHNSKIEKKNINHQIRLFLIEITKK